MNVLFILSDQHNAKVLGHRGHPDVRTPHLDRMAAEGVRFENAICQNPICTPSRMSYLSGQYCHNHGYYGLSGGRPHGLPSILGHFRRAGYRTAAIGKIHCPEYWIEDDADVFHETCDCSVGGRLHAYARGLVMLLGNVAGGWPGGPAAVVICRISADHIMGCVMLDRALPPTTVDVPAPAGPGFCLRH